MTTVQVIRTCFFYLLLSLSALIWGIVSFSIGPFLAYPKRYRFVTQNWCNFAIWLAKVVAGLNYRISGLENIPKQPCVILAKHQSTWETFFLSGFFVPMSQVLKRELFYVPVFGWAMHLVKPIAIDRSHPKAALKQLALQGQERLAEGNWVLIFPEGTRLEPGQIGKFSRGGAALAVNNNCAVLPIAHNAGRFWPKQGWAKYPGTIDLVIGPALYAEGEGPQAIAQLNERAFSWIKQTQQRIDCTSDSDYGVAKLTP